MIAAPDSLRARKARQTAEHLVRTAFELFEAHGYDNVTMEQIANAADVSKGTLYNYFKVKEALIQHRLKAEVADFQPLLRSFLTSNRAGDELLRMYLHKSAEYLARFKPYLLAYVHFKLRRDPSEWHEGRSGVDQALAAIISLGQEQGQFTQAQTSEELANYLELMMLATVMRWVRTPGLDLDVEYGRMLDVFLDGAREKQSAA